jgi:serine phosphatase RsbU (regulator of sigma subunit)/anti-sigma regulatory factor (Ser/Thr protein kinase)
VTLPSPAPQDAVGTRLPGTQQAAGAARRFLRATLAHWATPGIGDRLVDDATLLISELVTNAVVHAGTTADIVCRIDDGLVIEVSDRHPARMLRRDEGDGRGDEGGRGLHLVAAISDEWGITYRRDRKTVWCRLAFDPLPEAVSVPSPVPAPVPALDPFPEAVHAAVPDARPARPGPAAAPGPSSPSAVSAVSGASGPPSPSHPSGAGHRAAPGPGAAPALPPAGDRVPGRAPAELLAPGPCPAPGRPDAEWISRGSLSFLAEASDLLAGQLDEDNVASLAAQLLVPRLADWCAVWLYPTGAAPRLAHVWHGQEQHIDCLRTFLEKSPPEPDTRPGARRAPWPAVGDDPLCDRGGALRVPLVATGRCHGTLVMGRTGLPGLPDEVIHLVEDFARRVALALSTARQYARQTMISTVLQRGLLPPAAGRIPGVDHAVIYEPLAGDWVGGDFYDLFPAGDGRWCFALGDVCGNGPEAASLTGIARPVLRLLAREGYGVSDVLNRLNKALADEAATALLGETAAWDGGQPRFLSLLYGEITPYAPGYGAGCTLASAGHPLPLVLTPQGAVRPGAQPQMLLGIADDARYTSETLDLAPGDTLLCVTDGVTERRRGHHQFDDDDGLAAALRGCAGLNAADVADRIRQAVYDYDASPPADDLALLVLQAR